MNDKKLNNKRSASEIIRKMDSLNRSVSTGLGKTQAWELGYLGSKWF